jgi:quercetin dioxygenase-like cupin family protein
MNKKIIAGIGLIAIALGLYSTRGAVAQQAQAAPAAVGVTIQYSAQTENNNQPENFTAFTRVVYVAPGGGIPLHWHPGPFTVLVIEGELTHEDANGQQKVYKLGESWTTGTGPDTGHALWNKTKTMAKYVVMGLVPKGVVTQTYITK